MTIPGKHPGQLFNDERYGKVNNRLATENGKGS
jgi:hypothetical protein